MSVQEFVQRYRTAIVIAVLLFTPAVSVVFKTLGIVMGAMNSAGLFVVLVGATIYVVRRSTKRVYQDTVEQSDDDFWAHYA
jgi:predicted Kef-type K+ transport protein